MNAFFRNKHEADKISVFDGKRNRANKSVLEHSQMSIDTDQTQL